MSTPERNYSQDESSHARLSELWALVSRIPSGAVTTYGALGRELSNPVSGFTVGRWMASAPPGIPWWRVVTRSGTLAISKRDPHLAIEQRKRLESEGIRFLGDVVDMARHSKNPT